MDKNRFLRYLFFAAILGCAWGGYATYDRSSVSQIRVVANGSPRTEEYQGVMEMQRYIRERSDGEIDLKLYPYGEFCSTARECIAFLRSGVIDVFMTTGGGVVDIFPPAQIVDIPYALPGEAAAECVFDGPFTARLREAVLEHDPRLRLMVVGTTGGFRSIATVDKVVREPTDLEGVKIRTTAADLHQVLVRGFGASPTAISWSELYVSLATGVVDGTTNSVSDIVDANLHEQIKLITLDNHSYMGALWWYSEADWLEKDERSRQIVMEGFERLKQRSRDVSRANEADSASRFTESGGRLIELTEDQRARFVAAAAPVRDWYESLYGTHWLEQIDAAVAGCTEAAGS